MQGLHLTADLHQCGCDARWLTDLATLGPRCKHAVQQAGLQVVGELFHAFPSSAKGPGGMTATLLLAESHVCIHTWPELMAVTLDVYVCNFSADHSDKAQAVMADLIKLFQPRRCQQHTLKRGQAVD